MSPLIDAVAQKDWVGSVIHADPVDWITVVAYAVAAVLAWQAARSGRQSAAPAPERIFWAGTALLMIAFGINELLDLQTIVTDAGRIWAREQGWYEDRRLYQFEFIVALLAVVLIVGAVLLRFTRRTRRSVRVALVGLAFIAVFVLIRAASFHHVSTLLGMGPEWFTIGSMQELAGIIIVALAARSYAAPAQTRPVSPA